MPAETAQQLVQKLFIDHVDELKGFVTSLIPDPELVDDVVQETFVAVTARAAHYDPRQSFKAWLFIVARDKIREVGARADAEARPFADDVLEVLAASHKGFAMTTDQMRFLDECIAMLAPQARRIVALRYQNSMKPRHVAKALGWTAGSVRVALSRARAAIRECVDKKIAAVEG
jgi:RNA polymerase sigma-70 factor (ECF subfamily)